MFLNLPINAPGKYVLLLQYRSTSTGRNQEVEIDVSSPGSRRDRGRASLPGCPYRLAMGRSHKLYRNRVVKCSLPLLKASSCLTGEYRMFQFPVSSVGGRR